MMETIVPMVHGARRGYRRAVALHAGGAALTGGLVGAMAGTVGALAGQLGDAPDGLVRSALSAVALAAALREALAPRARIPGRRAQVPRRWSEELEPTPAALFYGMGLGVGFATHVASAAYWVTVALAVAAGHPAIGAGLGVLFGASRATATTILTRDLTTWEGARRRVAVLQRAERSMRLATAAGLAALAGALVI